jgi:hypothetical protein
MHLEYDRLAPETLTMRSCWPCSLLLIQESVTTRAQANNKANTVILRYGSKIHNIIVYILLYISKVI